MQGVVTSEHDPLIPSASPHSVPPPPPLRRMVGYLVVIGGHLHSSQYQRFVLVHDPSPPLPPHSAAWWGTCSQARRWRLH